MIYVSASIYASVADSTALTMPVFLWDNLVTAGGIAADDEDPDYPGANLGNPQTSSLWKEGATTPTSITFTIDPDDPVNAIGIARHNFGSGAVGVQIYGITAEPGAVYVLLADLAPGDDSPILAVVDSDYYIGIRIDLTPVSTEPQAAVVYIGSLLIMPRSTPPGYVPLKDGLERETLNGLAENGDFLGDITVSERYATGVEFRLLEGDWYRANMRDFVQSAVPFFYAYNPLEDSTEAGFCKFSGVPKATVSQFTSQVDISLSIIGLAL